ncbi:hypothetical protein [Bdellovibrio sp. HCB-110]|uniref:hypothetical protein n=1 Tax=Bdellovibrio sp. HCB-110 TaxID=3391182 RepID=UPI0039B55041
MGRRPVQNKKSPSEYPQIAFRLSKADKDRISDEIEAVQTLLNKRRKEGDPFVNKNDVFMWAIDEGLKTLRKMR